MQGAICGWSPYNYYVRMLSPVCFARMGILQHGCRRIYAGSKLLASWPYPCSLAGTTYAGDTEHSYIIIIWTPPTYGPLHCVYPGTPQGGYDKVHVQT